LRRLRAVGVSLRAAHQALNRLAEAGSAMCTIDPKAIEEGSETIDALSFDFWPEEWSG
jgi:hypothetical protein